MFLTILALAFTVLSETVAQEVSFNAGFDYNETCGLTQYIDWSSEGTVTLTQADLIGFEPKVVVRTCFDICTVDLTTCRPQDHKMTSHQPCHCTSHVDDKYHIHVGSRVSRSHAGGTLQAVVPGRGPLKNIFAAANIGTLPDMTDKRPEVNVSYTLDNSKPHVLMYSETLTVCSEKRVFLEICVSNGRRDSSLKITVDLETTVMRGGSCISHVITPGKTKAITFEYKEKTSYARIHQIFIKENVQACVHPTADTAASLSPTTSEGIEIIGEEVTTTTTTTTKTENTTSSTPIQIKGICPDTPRTVTTLPSGDQILTDDVTFNTSWTVFQRRVSGDVDFYRPWNDYVAGFGNVRNNFWIGLEKIHGLCNEENQCELLINLKYDEAPFNVTRIANGCYHAKYSKFWLGGSDVNYTLHVSGYTGTAGDCLLHGLGSWHNLNGRPFSTMDRDNDLAPDNCAVKSHGAWWYNACKASNLNGGWGHRKSAWSGVNWDNVTGDNSVTLTEMKVRRWI